MPPYDSVVPLKFQYGKDCVCENRVACRGLTAAFSLLGHDPRSGFVRLPNYKQEVPENTLSEYYRERNQQREVYLRYLLPGHAVEQETLAKDVALHHFHPRVVARLISKLQKNIPRTMTEKELKRLKIEIDDRDRILDSEGNPTGRCIFAPNYPIEKCKEDLKRLLRLCKTLNEASKNHHEKASSPASSPKTKRKKRRKFDPDIRSEGDLVVRRDRNVDRDECPEPEEEVVTDSLAEHNIQSLLESVIRLEPIPEDLDDSRDDEENNECNLKVETLTTQETDLVSVLTDDDPIAHNTATVSMQIRLEKLHTGKGKNRMTKMMQRPPSPFFEISVLHEADVATNKRETIYRSYPLTDTKNATWDAIESLDLNTDVHTPQDLSFRITVYDCDMKGGDHLLIGESEVNALDLIVTSSKSVPILRDDKVKGFLEVSSFQLHTDKLEETLDDESIVSELTPDDIEPVDGQAEEVETSSTNVEASIQFAHPSSPEVTRTIEGSQRMSGEGLPIVSPDGTDITTPFAIDSALEQDIDQTLPTSGEQVAVDNYENSYASASSISALCMPSVSMQISLEKLHAGQGKKKTLTGKMLRKVPSPFFDFAVLHKDEDSEQWETLYQSYPLVDTRSGTWEPVEDLNLGVLVHSSEELCFRVTVHDCDAKRGNHRLIGTAEVKSSELTGNMPTISIERGGKSKGILRFDRFDLDWSA